MIEQEITRLIDDARKSPELKTTARGSEPLVSFCRICRENGYEIYPAELLDYGHEMNDSKLRATNGGGSFEIEGWNDAFENLISELESNQKPHKN